MCPETQVQSQYHELEFSRRCIRCGTRHWIRSSNISETLTDVLPEDTANLDRKLLHCVIQIASGREASLAVDFQLQESGVELQLEGRAVPLAAICLGPRLATSREAAHTQRQRVANALGILYVSTKRKRNEFIVDQLSSIPQSMAREVPVPWSSCCQWW